MGDEYPPPISPSFSPIYPPSHAQPLSASSSASLSTTHYCNWRVWGDTAERQKEGEKKRKVERERERAGERFLEVRGPALFHSPSAMCFFFSHHLSFYLSFFLNQEACICFGFSLKKDAGLICWIKAG